MRIAWITDPHLNHCSLPQWEQFLERIANTRSQAMLITGDLSEGEDVAFQLSRLADAIGLPLYFVLGNHDFYHRSIDQTRRELGTLSAKHPLLHYLRDQDIVELLPNVALIGEDGWGDATEGDYDGSYVSLNDFRLIDDFCFSHRSHWRKMLWTLGHDAAERLYNKLDAACQSYANVLVAIHVPPCREACWYEGHTTDDHWAPFFVCGQAGQALRTISSRYPNTRLQVLCGHTHHAGEACLAPNLTITTGGAQYGAPEVAAVIELGQMDGDQCLQSIQLRLP